MKFNKIEWKNVFSYGNNLEELVFDDKGSLWQLCGQSGAGKTSIIQLPYLVLYGETINGVKLTGIPNRNNTKGSLVRGYLTNGKDEFIIERNFSPHTISITKNGEHIDLPGVDSNQDYIKNEILCGIPKSVYKNIMTLSLNTDVSFIDMGVKDKRNIIDFLLDMEVLNYYTELLKKDNTSVTQSINESNGSVNVIDRNLQRAKYDLEQKKNVLNSQSKTDLDENSIREKIQEINEQFKAGRVKYISELNDSISSLQSNRSIESMKMGTAQSQLSQLNSQLKLLMNDKCPTCGSSFKTDSFDALRDNLRKMIDDKEFEVRDFSEGISKIDEKIKKMRDEIIKINGELSIIDTKIQEMNELLLGSEKYRNAKSTYENALHEVERLESERVDEGKKITENEKDVRLLGILKNVYSDSGVKKILREKYVPELNREINKSLDSLGISYKFEFDNNFEAVIYDRGDKVQIETLSGGEKQRANIAVLYSLIKIIKNKYPQINVVALDETTSHVDSENGMETFKFFRQVSEELNLNIFVVTHTEIIDDSVFNHRIFIEKRQGYSNIVKK